MTAGFAVMLSAANTFDVWRLAMPTRLIQFCFVGAFVFGSVGAVRAGEPNDERALKADLGKLEGKWEFTFTDKDGKVVVRKVKEIKSNNEKVTWYLPDNTIYAVNTVEFRLEAKGKDKMYRYFNGKVVDGPAKGEKFPDGSFLYSLDGDTWTEITDSGEKFAWKRVKSQEK
jgi:hypothetical protein